MEFVWKKSKQRQYFGLQYAFSFNDKFRALNTILDHLIVNKKVLFSSL